MKFVVNLKNLFLFLQVLTPLGGYPQIGLRLLDLYLQDMRSSKTIVAFQLSGSVWYKRNLCFRDHVIIITLRGSKIINICRKTEQKIESVDKNMKYTQSKITFYFHEYDRLSWHFHRLIHPLLKNCQLNQHPTVFMKCT